MLIPENQKYEDVERKTIKFIAQYLINNNLSVNHVMRGLDLNTLGSPLHLSVDKDKWRAFIKGISDVYTLMKDRTYNDSFFEGTSTTTTTDTSSDTTGNTSTDTSTNTDATTTPVVPYSPTYTDEEVRKIYIDTNPKLVDPDDRDIAEIVYFKPLTTTDSSKLKHFTSAKKTVFNYSVTNNPSGEKGHCNRGFDALTAKATPDSTLQVEPIYPDLITPPGYTTTLVNKFTDSTVSQSNEAPLSVDEFEKRQNTFNIKDYKDAVKEVKGKPLNNNDPYPVDDKIKELESHQPKLKIDEVNSKLNDCNHPGSVIGVEVSKNFAMIQDEIMTLAKRTETRMVRLENMVSTLTRYLFSSASRMNINCVYYGGQDIYGKYKCIRCTHNDRINDGQSMTLDQCLSCTRYEPIYGQIYAILDDEGSNVSQVLDDMQAAYMSMDEYIKLTRTEEVHDDRKYADMTKNEDSQPKTFYESYSEDTKEGFKMDWNKTPLENQRPDIAEYVTENIKENKATLTNDEQNVKIEDEFKNTIDKNEAYETLKYNSDDYKFEGFGTNYLNTSGGGMFGMGSSQIRKKIVDRAKAILEMCHQSKAGYSQDTRYVNEDANGTASDGINYYDCSSFVEACYKAAGITSVAGWSDPEYFACISNAGGFMGSTQDMSGAKPGDVLFCKGGSYPTDEDGFNSFSGGTSHVAIYIGDGQFIAASTNRKPLTEQISQSTIENYNQYSGKTMFSYGRPKELVEADKKAVEGAVYDGEVPIPNFDYKGLSDTQKEWLNTMAVICIKASLKYPQLFASLAIAQGAQESGWGSNIPTGSNNYFGVKASAGWTGRTVNAKTGEQTVAGDSYTINADFRAYDNPEESAYDRYQFLIDNSRYADALTKTTPYDQLVAIRAAGYATDVNYVSEIYDGILIPYNMSDADRVVEELRAKIEAEKESGSGDVSDPGISQQFISCNIGSRSSTPTWIVIHDTGGPNQSAQSIQEYFAGGAEGRQASADFAVDDSDIIQCVDDDHYSYNCGDDEGDGRHLNGCTNESSIGIEMCVLSSSGSYDDAYVSDTTQQNTIKLVRYLMSKYSIGIDNICRHYDVSHKICPGTFYKGGTWQGWTDFLAKLTEANNNSGSGTGDVDLSNATEMSMDLSFYTGEASEGGSESASGKALEYGMCASNDYPFGTRFYFKGINGLDDRTFTVEDRGGSDFDSSSRLDIYVGNDSDAKAKADTLGRQTVTAYKLN
jgi:flagellum-specific peptidoglycan hydrolase FlgJ/N-acetylmuramoyl-L-alanine amidase CwlA